MFRKIYRKSTSLLKNYLLKRDIASSKIKPFSRPTQITLNLSTKCNYNCPICSMGKAKKLFPNYQNNMITRETVEKMHEFFCFAQSVSFMGLLGEPLVNPDFFGIVDFFRKNTTTSLSVSTNGLLLNQTNRENFINYSFEAMTFSLHGATEDSYEKLQGHNFNRVIENLSSLISEKRCSKSTCPYITIVHALNWWNIHELPIFLDLMKEISPDRVFIYHYRDYEGIEENISLKGGNIQKANDLISSAYDYAKKIGVYKIIEPKDPPLVVPPDKDLDLKFKQTRLCDLPWRGLQLRGCISHVDSFYVGCCNVFNVFRLDYQKFEDLFEKVWHHPVLMYLRETVNGENVNPICRYCKSPERNYLKSVDNKKNNAKKALVIEEFFEGFKTHFGNISGYNLTGLTILEQDPADIKLE